MHCHAGSVTLWLGLSRRWRVRGHATQASVDPPRRGLGVRVATDDNRSVRSSMEFFNGDDDWERLICGALHWSLTVTTTGNNCSSISCNSDLFW